MPEPSLVQALLDAIGGTLDPHTQIADHPNVKFAQMQRLDLVETLRHFAGCVECYEDHGSYPESVSCYCRCHDGAEERWPYNKRRALKILSENAKSSPSGDSEA
jgi:hypothetical protein